MEQVPAGSSQVVDQVQSTTQAQPPQPTLAADSPQPDPDISPGPPRKSFLKPLIVVVILGVLAGGIAIAYRLINRNRGVVQDVQQETSFGSTPSRSRLGMAVSDNFEVATLNEELWFPWALSEKSRVELKGGKIEIEIPPGFSEYTSAALNLLPIIDGDFEASVDASILVGGDTDGSETALVFHDDVGEPRNQLSIFLRKEEGRVFVRATQEVNGEYENLDFVKSYDHSGPFTIRITRNKGKVTFSVKEGSEFVTLGTLSSGFYGGRGKIALHVNSYGENFPAVLSNFDNFVLKLL